MSPDLACVLAVLVAYLLGAIPFGLVVGKAWKGIDIRQHGSGNLGATNALRVLGKPVGVTVLLLDALKGAGPVLAFPALLARLELPPPGWLPAALALAAILGHVFPVYLRFKGGKGVATSAGAFGALHPPAFGVALLTFAVIVAGLRIVSLGSVLAAVALPTAAILLDGPDLAFGLERARTAALVLVGLLVVVRHRANLARLWAGTEPRLGHRAGPAASSEQTAPDS
ncbi:MAG: acyl-phosphate glycerol 3-phosphate acyltransferase [Maricaulis sp.]|nr:acyl-phosphate glycerol 3-phosphate acyltransferase [Maricaulis sp.]